MAWRCSRTKRRASSGSCVIEVVGIGFDIGLSSVESGRRSRSSDDRDVFDILQRLQAALQTLSFDAVVVARFGRLTVVPAGQQDPGRAPSVARILQIVENRGLVDDVRLPHERLCDRSTVRERRIEDQRDVE